MAGPVPPLRPLPARPDFPRLEEEVLERWRERDVFHESVRRRQGAEPYVFYEGPPTANGRPAAHHVLARAFKDIFPRYQTMRGRYVERKGGWDCHGLPVEIAVEQKLGFTSKADIERYGIAEFNQKCRESVFEYLEDWNALTERIGYWVDLDEAYRTLDNDYVESVWWALKTMWDRDLLYEGYKVVPYCARDGTALSSHEVAQGYRDVEDPSVYVRFPVTRVGGTGSVLREGDKVLAWTTTPWTLLSNAALAVAPDLAYVRTADGHVVAEARAEAVLGEDLEVVDRFHGRDMLGAGYEPPFSFIATEEFGPKGHTIVPGDFVSAEDGTGVVHTSISFGEDDFRIGLEQGIPVVNPVRLDGTFEDRMGPFAGRWVKEADPDIVEALRDSGRLLRSERLLHSYPHCWRCGTPLLYYAKPSWYIRTSSSRDRMLAANETIEWHPEHVKHGRFGKWLENNVDWAISRERYWGTPLPVWRNEGGETIAIGSFDELERLSGVRLEDPHRPYVDEVEIPSPTGGEPLRRVPEVIDVWFDSGAMPFAQWHAPHENEEHFRERFPADYICEALDQTRGWFYSLLAISTLLFDQAPYRTCLCLGLISDEQGKKMSKSQGNIVVPWEVIERHGADAFRWYFFTSKLPWDGYLFSVETVGESVRQFLLQLWNTYSFLVLYTNVNDVTEWGEPETELDRWALSRLHATTEVVRDRLDHYDATRAGHAIATFVEELSNWYVRRSRPRFWDGDPAAFGTLRTCLVGVAHLLAPFCPFVADEIYDNLDGTEPSVHLCDFPEVGARDVQLEAAMGVVRETVRLGLAARGQAKLGVRQPLRAAVVVAAGAERAAIERLEEIVRAELNVKELRYVSQADELGSYEVKPNYRALGPRFGRHMPQAAAAVAALEPSHVAAALREGRLVGISVDGHDHELGPDDLLLAISPLEGYQLEREGSHAVALELELDDELVREGLAREIVHAVQNARRTACLEVADRIELTLGGDDELLEAARAFEPHLAGETLAVRVGYDGAAGEEATVKGRPLYIAVERA
jgi:isoleucyl-tRNA synthetase